MEVESTIRPAKDRIAGFEGREGHRTPFAPVEDLKRLIARRQTAPQRWCQLWCQSDFEFATPLRADPTLRGERSTASSSDLTKQFLSSAIRLSLRGYPLRPGLYADRQPSTSGGILISRAVIQRLSSSVPQNGPLKYQNAPAGSRSYSSGC